VIELKQGVGLFSTNRPADVDLGADTAGREAAGHADGGSDSGVAQKIKLIRFRGWFEPAVYHRAAGVPDC
jgi:hypothetical protein